MNSTQNGLIAVDDQLNVILLTPAGKSLLGVMGGYESMPIKCYRLSGSGADRIAVGDTITVTGTIVNFQHSSGDTEVEFTQGCTLVSWSAGGSTPDIPDTPDTPDIPDIPEV